MLIISLIKIIYFFSFFFIPWFQLFSSPSPLSSLFLHSHRQAQSSLLIQALLPTSLVLHLTSHLTPTSLVLHLTIDSSSIVDPSPIIDPSLSQSPSCQVILPTMQSPTMPKPCSQLTPPAPPSLNSRAPRDQST